MEDSNCDKYEKKRKELHYFLNPSIIALFIFLFLAIVVIVAESITWQTWEIPLIQISLIFIVGAIVFVSLIFLWAAELFISAWTLALSPIILITPSVILLAYRKILIEGDSYGNFHLTP